MIVATHSGPFHADDVYACALIKRYMQTPGGEKIKFVRTRDQSVIDTADVVVDVGGIYDPTRCRFDHHQNDYTGNRSSVGMVLDYLEEYGIVNPDVAAEFRSVLIDELDDADTNGTPSAMSLLIWAMNPQWDDEDPTDFNNRFEEAVAFANRVLDVHNRAVFSKVNANHKLDYLVRSFSGAIVESEEYLPDMAVEISQRSSQAKFVMWPSSETQWMVQCVPPVGDRTSQRLPFPETVAGLRGSDLEAVVGDLGSDVNPASPFVHKGAFIGGAATREGAYALAQFALRSLSAGIEL